ncbi:vertebrate ancient opsin-like isoform X2 [Penaeus japonicus]|uniref:vertebrate ancient opsin-like isoform X2 n=1 Tax=Penaeus japonicus TaxID=27405 RepID=UPI001C70DD97|nr:vertebrate ancient opsin-like isoform X2 [Penaeus japonicus]
METSLASRSRVQRFASGSPSLNASSALLLNATLDLLSGSGGNHMGVQQDRAGELSYGGGVAIGERENLWPSSSFPSISQDLVGGAGSLGGGGAGWGANSGNHSNYPVSMRLSEEGYYLSAFFLFIIGSLGMFNNLVVLIVMAKNKQLRSPLNLFLINLAISDFGISVVGNPISLMAALNRGWYFSNHVCVGYAFLMSFFGITSIGTLMVLAFERYLMISRPWKTSELTQRGAILAIMGVWVYSFLTTAPPLAGWGGFGVEGPGISCSIDWETRSFANTSYIVFLFALGLGIPLMIMIFSYANVISTLRQAGNSGLQAGVARAERRVALMVVVMGLTFLLAWTPYSVMALIVAFGDPTLVTPGAAVVPAIFAKSSCMYNPIIYVGLNTQFRSAWSRLLCCREEEPAFAHGGQTTEKLRRMWRGKPTSQASSDMKTMSTEAVPLKVLQLNPNKVQYDTKVSTTAGGEVHGEIV